MKYWVGVTDNSWFNFLAARGLDEEALEAFHGTVSLPFAAGDNKKVAVKIVDDRGIESLRIVNLED